ncbi:MAG: 4Fe-4S binding protein [Acidobacteria bacterium]|nr:4Fe-4S binding protein [Acidobacteriota bacterium]
MPSGAGSAPSPGPRPKPIPEIVVKVSWCKGCGLCVDYCNRGVLKMDGVLPSVVAAEKCTRCLQCEAICPDFAIEVKDKAEPPEEGR